MGSFQEFAVIVYLLVTIEDTFVQSYQEDQMGVKKDSTKEQVKLELEKSTRPKHYTNKQERWASSGKSTPIDHLVPNSPP